MGEYRKYSDELKAEAVKLVLDKGMSREEVSRQLQIPKGSIGNWVSAAKAGKAPMTGEEKTSAEMSAEIAKLRKDLNEMRLERDILKKATAYFAKESLQGTRG
jgi:transposase